MRVSLGAVNVASGEMSYFDSRDPGAIDVRHMLASGALPPAFPAVEIDWQFYWDGGLYSNTPVDVVTNDRPRQDCRIFAVNLWHGDGDAPASIALALARMKDIQFASRANHNIESEGKLHRLRHVVRELGMCLPEDMRAQPEIAELLSWGCRTVMHVLRFNAPRMAGEDPSKDIDFSSSGNNARRVAVYEDACRALESQAWTKAHDPLDGIVVHDARAEDGDASFRFGRAVCLRNGLCHPARGHLHGRGCRRTGRKPRPTGCLRFLRRQFGSAGLCFLPTYLG